MRKAVTLMSVFAVAGCISSGALVAEPAGVWLAGDTHVHTDHSSDGSLPRQSSDQRLPGNLPVRDQIAEAERNGLDFLALTDHRTFDQHWDPQWVSPRLVLLTGEEANGRPHAIVLGATDHIVDGANPPGSPSFRHIQQSVWDAHAQNAVWSVAHPDNGEIGDDGQPNADASVIGADLVEIWNPSSNPDAQVDYAENRWNRGFRFGVAAASDSHYRELWDKAGPGKPTTWVFAADRSPRAILDAMQAGRTAVSRNPGSVFATLEGDFDGDGAFEALSGDEITAAAGNRAQLRVKVRNGVGANVYVYRSPGRTAGTIAFFQPAAPDESRVLPLTLDEGNTWFRVEVRAPGDLSGLKANPLLPDQLRAATAPIFVSTTGFPAPQPEIDIPLPAATEDGSAQVVGAQNRFTGFADVSVSENATHVVAESETRVVYRKLASEPVATIDLSSGPARFPRVAASGAHVWVVWQQENGIFARHSADRGLTWEPEFQVSDGAARAIHPSIALLNETCPVFAWADNRSSAFDVYARVLCQETQPQNLSALGKTLRAGNSFDARSPRTPASLFPAIAINRSGKIFVSWQDNRFDPDPLWTGHTPRIGEAPGGGTDPDNWEILVSVRDANLPIWQTPVRVNANDSLADRHPSMAIHGSGTILIAWDSKPLQNSGANLTVQTSQSADEGSTWSPAQSVGHEPAAMSQRPRIAADADGTMRAVWYDSRASDWRWQVFTSRLQPDMSWSPALQLTHASNNTWPALSHGTVVFTSDRRASRVQRDRTHEIYICSMKMRSEAACAPATTN